MSEQIFNSVEQRRQFMRQSARALGSRAWELIGQGGITAQRKPDGTIVTSVDIDLNNQFIEMIGAEFPHDLVWGEEASNSEKGNVSLADKRWTWIIDPIDGTRGFWRCVRNKSFSDSNTTILMSAFAPGETTPTLSLISNPFNRQPSLIATDPTGAYYRTKRSKEERRILVPDDGPRRIADVERYDENSWDGAQPDLRNMGKMMPFARRINHPLGFVAVALGDADLGAFPGPLSQPHDVSAAAHAVHMAEGSAGTLEGAAYYETDWRLPVRGVVLANNDTLREDFVVKLRSAA